MDERKRVFSAFFVAQWVYNIGILEGKEESRSRQKREPFLSNHRLFLLFC